MGIIYSPLLLITAWYEVHEAKRVTWNRRRNQEDDDTMEEWEQLADEMPDFGSTGWSKKVENTKPDVTTDADVIEMKELRKEVAELKDMLAKVIEK
ncbi:Calcium channel yvc1, partial [Elasticomyces elasticus]